jgi:hypothetical protein
MSHQFPLDNQHALVPSPTREKPTLLTVLRDIADSLRQANALKSESNVLLRQVADALTPVEPELVGTDYIKAKRGCTVTYAAQMAREGKIPARCIAAGNGDGDTWKFYRKQVDEWLNTQKVRKGRKGVAHAA